ncbi:MAG: DUF255 domain-containing protein [Bacteroidales bacterium]
MQNMSRSLCMLIYLILSSSFLLSAQTRIATPSPAQVQTVASPKIEWLSFEEALNVNACLSKPKKVFIDVYTDWCGWCKRLDATTFAHPEIVKYMQSNFIPVKFNAERTDTVRINNQIFVNPSPNTARKGTHEIAAILLKGQMSYPSCTFLDETGKQLDVIPGYMDVKKFECLLHYIGEDAYKTVKWEDWVNTFVSHIQ